ncbi:hypothetical protein EfmGK961_09370 [Enterococcus faecium]|nr:hypothetical protein EfmGK961_09370 [Enterococcus faecium]
MRSGEAIALSKDDVHITNNNASVVINGISNGQIRRWDKASPKSENLKKVADYFGVTTDYLLGNNNVPKWLKIHSHD